MCNLLHSFVSDRCNDRQIFIQFCYFCLSCLYAKNNGYNIDICTDKKFGEYVKILPYNHISYDLENIRYHNDLFAYAKLISLNKNPLGTIHIDGDVFFKKPNIIKSKNWDVIVQCHENRKDFGYLNTWNDTPKSLQYITYPDYMMRELNDMYNLGVIGFNNKDLFKKWYDNYFIMIDQYQGSQENDSIPDIIFEQQNLYDICQTDGYNVYTLLNGGVEEYHTQAINIGYQHVIEKEQNINRCLNTINKLFNKYYHMIKDMCNSIYPEYFE